MASPGGWGEGSEKGVFLLTTSLLGSRVQGEIHVAGPGLEGCLGGGVGSLRTPQMAWLCGTAREKLVSQLHCSEAIGMTSCWNDGIGPQEIKFSCGCGYGPFSPQVVFLFPEPLPCPWRVRRGPVGSLGSSR